MKASAIIKQKPYLLWSTKNYDNLSDAAVVEAVLNYGDWDDVQQLIKILGVRRVASLFRKQSSQRRNNYAPDIANYFRLYFKKHA